LLFYTDGWTEAATDEGEYGIGRAAAVLRRVNPSNYLFPSFPESKRLASFPKVG
jgi:hypothetical protein